MTGRAVADEIGEGVGLRFAGNTELTKGDSMMDVEGLAVLAGSLGAPLANAVAPSCRGALSAPRLPVVALVATAPSWVYLAGDVERTPLPIAGPRAEVILAGVHPVAPALSRKWDSAVGTWRASSSPLFADLGPSESRPTLSGAGQSVANSLCHKGLSADGTTAIELSASCTHGASGATAKLGTALDAMLGGRGSCHPVILPRVANSRKEILL